MAARNVTLLEGRLKPRASRGATPLDFSGYSVALIYSREVLGEPKLVERRARVASDGSYALSVSDAVSRDKTARIAVLAPSGEMLARHGLVEIAGRGGRLRDIALSPPRIDFRPSEIQLSASLSMTLKGRLLVTPGAPETAAGVPLVLLGQAEDGAEPTPIWTGATDRQGYFFADGVRAAGWRAVQVSLGRSGAANRVIDVRLGAGGALPNPLFIIVEDLAADGGTKDCACHGTPPARPGAEALAEHGATYSQDLGTSCQSFTTPNRTLEAFDFFQIVRTTDPSIKGLTLPPGRTSSVLADRMGKIVFDAGTLAQATDASAYAVQQEIAAERTAAALAMPTLAARSMITFDKAVSAARRSVRPGEFLSVDGLSSEGTAKAALWRMVSGEDAADAALKSAVSKIPPRALAMALEDPDGFTPDKVMTLERHASAEALRAYLGARARSAAGRAPLNEDNPIDWDYTPEFYQATSVAHGHILHFKQTWKADGYSLGDLLQSIPLAPGQQKQIVTLDWDRDDRATRREQTDAVEALTADISRDRDINEIANAAFRENLSGESSARTGAVGGGLGLAIGPLVIGGGGGSSWASSTASSRGTRDFSAQSMNRLSDQTSQAASAVRSQRSTVVETVSQDEAVRATTEVISNFNRCHALTVQYFEVLRHFAVQELLSGVSECLFVPLEMTLFDDRRILRWREILQRACRSASLRRAFDSVERLSSPVTTPPDQRYADDPVEEMSGRLRFRVAIARPKDPDEAGRAVLEQTEWRFLGITLRVSPETIYELYSRNERKKDEVFRNEIAPKVAQEFLNSLEIVLIDRDGQEHPADFDLTVASRYQENGVMEVELNDNAVTARLPRAEVAGIEVRTNYQLPEFSKVILEDARVVYRTERIRHFLCNRRRINDDVLVGDPAFVSTGDLSWREERNKLREDRKRRRRLIRHLNDNIEYYHRAIWLGMDPNRRFMLLDGFEAPNAGGRSVASVVENRLIGIVGNCMVMPVAPGFQLDPVLREVLKDEDDPREVLKKLYDVAPSPPRRRSVPTRGVFGEAMPGTCRSCEEIDEDRFWRWSDYPLPDSPPAIAALSTDSRFAELGGLKPTPFPQALVNYQTVPDAPAPTGMAAALEILGKDVFKDLSGLTQNQKNAMAAFTAAMTSAEAFGGEAVSLALARDSSASLDRTLGQIETAKQAGYLDDKQASQAARDALTRSFAADKSPTQTQVTGSAAVKEAISQAASTPGGSATITRQNGDETETVAFETGEDAFDIGAAPRLEWIDLGFWVDLPWTRDSFAGVPPSPFKNTVRAISRFDKIDDARNEAAGTALVDAAGDFIDFDAFGFPKTPPAGSVRFDIIQAAIDAGVLRANPADATRLQMRIETKLGYPARSSSKAAPKAVHFPHSGKRKMPLLVIVHGNAAALVPTGPAAAVALPDGRSAAKGALVNVPNHEGYKYLQDHLSKQADPIITLSVSTNIANATGSNVELRAEMVNAAIKALKDEIATTPDHFLTDAIDFDNVGLMGHSRGGEAVVRAHQLNLVAGDYTAKAVCSLAPTDFTGTTLADKVSVDNATTSYLVVWGGLDGDVSGVRRAGSLGTIFTGSGARIYDRSKAHKAMIFAPACSHNRFNNPVWKDETEWRKVVAGVPSLDLPAGIASEAEHEKLAIEYIGGFFDLTLNGKAALQPLFRNETATTTGLALGHQWNFSSSRTVIDDFQGASANTGVRTLGPGMSVTDHVQLIPPAAAAAGARDLHVPNQTRACILDLAAAGGATSVLSYDLSSPAPIVGMDMSGFDLLTFRIGQLFDPTSQATINAQAPPDFEITLTDDAGDKLSVDSATLFAGLKTPLPKPLFKEIGRSGATRNATQMLLNTVSVAPAAMIGLGLGPVLGADLTRITGLDFEFDTSAGSGEIWIDSIQLVKK